MRVLKVLGFGGGAVLAGAACAQPVVRAALLSSMDPVPGVPGATFAISSPPTQLDSAGRVSFVGGFSGPSGTGVWSEGSGTLRLVAIEGGPVPGVAGAVFGSFSGVNLVMSDNDRVAFRTSINPGNLTGVWSQEGPELALVALHGRAAPGAPAGNWELNNNLPTVNISTAGLVAFKGGVTTPLPVNSYVGMFKGSPSGVGMCSRTAAAPDSGFTSFGEIQIGDSGRLGFATSLRLPSGSSVAGIFEGECGGPNTLVVSGDIVPSGLGLPASTTFQQPRDPSFGAPGTCAFVTGLAGPGITGASDSAIMMAAPSGYLVVAREGSAVPGLPAGVVYSDFTSGSLRGPLMSVSGHVAYLCTITGGGTDSTNNRVLLVRRPDGVFRTVARLGDTPASYPPTTVILGFGNGSFAINASGQIVVETTLFGAPSNRGSSLFVSTNPDGDASVLIESGTFHTVRPGLDLRVLSPTTGPLLSNGHDGRPHNWNDAGQLAYRAGYAAPAHPNVSLGVGIFVVGGQPPPPACPADFNGDGNIDPDDLSDYIACYFTLPPCGQADVNGDGSADPDDLSDFIALFFGGCG